MHQHAEDLRIFHCQDATWVRFDSPSNLHYAISSELLIYFSCHQLPVQTTLSIPPKLWQIPASYATVTTGWIYFKCDLSNNRGITHRGHVEIPLISSISHLYFNHSIVVLYVVGITKLLWIMCQVYQYISDWTWTLDTHLWLHHSSESMHLKRMLGCHQSPVG